MKARLRRGGGGGGGGGGGTPADVAAGLIVVHAEHVLSPSPPPFAVAGFASPTAAAPLSLHVVAAALPASTSADEGEGVSVAGGDGGAAASPVVALGLGSGRTALASLSASKISSLLVHIGFASLVEPFLADQIEGVSSHCRPCHLLPPAPPAPPFPSL